MRPVCCGENAHQVKNIQACAQQEHRPQTPMCFVCLCENMHTCILVCDSKTKRCVLCASKPKKETAGREKTIIIQGDTQREKIKKERVPE